MKVFFSRIALSLFFLLALACQNDDDGMDVLPPITETGENTFGCKIDGKVLIPKGRLSYQCFYQFIDGEYYFGLSISDETREDRSCSIFTRMRAIEEGKTYDLTMQFTDEQGYGGIVLFSNAFFDLYETNQEVTGELMISKLQSNPNIVSGTFWFNAINEEGEIVEVRDGRFDALYNR